MKAMPRQSRISNNPISCPYLGSSSFIDWISRSMCIEVIERIMHGLDLNMQLSQEQEVDGISDHRYCSFKLDTTNFLDM